MTYGHGQKWTYGGGSVTSTVTSTHGRVTVVVVVGSALAALGRKPADPASIAPMSPTASARNAHPTTTTTSLTERLAMPITPNLIADPSTLKRLQLGPGSSAECSRRSSAAPATR